MKHQHKHGHHHGEHECRCNAKVQIQTDISQHNIQAKESLNTATDTVGDCACSQDSHGHESLSCSGEDDEDSHHSCSSSHLHSEEGHSHSAHAHSHNHGSCSHGHSHGGIGHSHNHTVESLDSVNKAFYIGIGLNLAFTIIEFIIGYFSNSLALLADASHNLSDVASLVISLIGLKLAQKASNSLYTYGYKKASILASLVNAIILVIIAANISIEAIHRMTSAPQVIGKAIIITAIIGVFINTLSAFLFFKGQKDDINIKGAFLHLMVDAAVSVGVVISGIIIYYTDWHIIDPIISIIIAIIVLMSTWGLLKESVKLTLDGVPQNVDTEKVKDILLKNKKIEEFHDLHIWALSSSQNALTVHISLKEEVNVNDFMEIKYHIKKDLEKANIHHATIELGSSGICEFSC